MGTLGFEDYIEPLKLYLSRYKETVEPDTKGSTKGHESSPRRDGLQSDYDQNAQGGNANHGSSDWRCLISPDGKYTVESLRMKVDQSQFTASPSLVSWRKEIPIKVIGFVWKAAQGRIASATALYARGVPITSTACITCGDLEDADHILFTCPFAAQVRSKLSHWCGVSFTPCNNIKSLLDLVNHWGRCPKKRNLLIMIVYGMLWRLWNFRNEKVFKARNVSVSGVFEDIISTVFFWAKYRAQLGNCSRDSWSFSPFICL